MTAQHDPHSERVAGRAPRRAPSRDRSSSAWVPVAELPPLARALLSADLGGRDSVPRHVAERVTALAAEWEAAGFTAQTVGPWKEVPPAAAAYLASHGVDPSLLDLPVSVYPRAPEVALRVAIAAERISVEQAYELLVLAGEHLPQAPVAEPKPAPARPVAPVIFSHIQKTD